MKLVFFSTYLPSTFLGGAEILTELVTQELAKHGHNVTIYTGGDRRIWHHNGVTIHATPLLRHIPLRTFISPIRAQILEHVLRSEKPILDADILHAVDTDSLTLLAQCPSAHTRLIATIQDYGMVCPAGDLLLGDALCPNCCHSAQGFRCLEQRRVTLLEKSIFNMQYSIRKTIRDGALRMLRHAVCVSRFVETELLRVAPHIRTHIIGNCVTDDWFNTARIKKDIDILYVGRLARYKGVDVLIDAISQIQNKHMLSVCIVGGGDHAFYRSMIHEKGLDLVVRIVHQVPYEKTMQYYRRAHMVVAPSIWPEPCGRTIIEGMAVGCPVIATNSGGTPEALKNGVNGILIQPGNVHVLSSAITYLLTHKDKAYQMGVNAKRYAQKAYNSETIVGKYESVYGLLNKEK